jgi:2-dehydropantoate 2-reductase
MGLSEDRDSSIHAISGTDGKAVVAPACLDYFWESQAVMEIAPRKIAVIGAGPVGGILSAHLCLAGHQVTLVEVWKEHSERIRSHGLRITGNEELLARPAHLAASIRDLDDVAPEFVFICTKACDLDNVLGEIGNGLKQSDAIFISAQNGIDTEQIIVERLSRERVLRAVISFGGFLTGPGEIRETFFNPPNYMGWLDERSAAHCKEAAAIVTAAGLAMEATAEIQKYAWRKTLLNTCTMAIAAVTGMNMQEMMKYPSSAQLVGLLLKEAIAVAAVYGFDYGPDFFEVVMEFNERAGPHRPSMLVDLENGRRTENRFLIRRIADYAEQKGISAPMHRTMASLIDALELRNIEIRRKAQTNFS